MHECLSKWGTAVHVLTVCVTVCAGMCDWIDGLCDCNAGMCDCIAGMCDCMCRYM